MLFLLIRTFDHEQQDEEQQADDEDDIFIFIEIKEKGLTKLVKVITEREKHCIPHGDANSREKSIGWKGLFTRAGDKCDISPADGYDPAEADCYFSVVPKSAV